MVAGRTFFACSLLLCVGSETHSLWFFITLTADRTSSLIEYIVVGKVDDMTIATFTGGDLNQHWKPRGDDAIFVKENVFQLVDTRTKMVAHIQGIMSHFNHTGFHTLQRLAGCELDDDERGRVGVWEAYDGEPFLDIAQGSGPWNSYSSKVNTLMFSNDVMSKIIVNLYYGECLSLLRMYVAYGKNILNRQVKPRVRVLHKNMNHEGTVVTCLATGFYPRHINITLMKDGQPVPPDQLEQGDILPNGDGTYQQRKSMVISVEERERKANYTCTVSHNSLDNKINVNWALDAGSVWERKHIGSIFGIALFLGLVLILIAFAIRKWKK